MSSNFAFILSTLTDTEDAITELELPIFKELAYDFETGQLKTVGGQYYYVEKNEALKIWIYKALFSSRYTYLAYSSNYGNEIYTLIGWYLQGDILKSELNRMIEDALLVNPYIVSLGDFEATQKGAKVFCGFSVNTVYGEIAGLTYEYAA